MTMRSPSFSSFSLLLLLLIPAALAALDLLSTTVDAVNADFGRVVWLSNFGTGLYSPISLSVDSTGALYFIDGIRGVNRRLFKLSTSGADVSSAYVAANSLGLGQSGVGAVAAVAVDRSSAADNVYVANTTNVFRLSSSGALLYTFPQSFYDVISLSVTSSGTVVVVAYPSMISNPQVTLLSATTGLTLSQLTLYGSATYDVAQFATVDSTGRFWYTTSDAHTVYIASSNGTQLAALPIPSNPTAYMTTGLWLSSSGSAFVSWAVQGGSDRGVPFNGFIGEYSTTSLALVARHQQPLSYATPNATQMAPYSITGDNAGTLIYLDGYYAHLVYFNAATDTTIRTLYNGAWPIIKSADASGQSYALDGEQGAYMVLSATGALVRYIPALTSTFVPLTSYAATDYAGTTLVALDLYNTLRVYSITTGVQLSSFPVPIPNNCYVMALAMDSSLNLYFAFPNALDYTYSSTVTVLSITGTPLRKLTVPSYNYASSTALSIDAANTLYAANSTTLVRSTVTGTVLNTIPLVRASSYIVADPAGYVYLLTAMSDANGVDYDFVLSATSFNSSSVSYTAVLGSYRTTWPIGLAIDGSGDLYLGDLEQRWVKKVRGLSSTAAPLPPLGPSSSSTASPASRSTSPTSAASAATSVLSTLTSALSRSASSSAATTASAPTAVTSAITLTATSAQSTAASTGAPSAPPVPIGDGTAAAPASSSSSTAAGQSPTISASRRAVSSAQGWATMSAVAVSVAAALQLLL